MYCDLHTHSTASDGSTPPENLPTLARQCGLSALALTDHDTTAGLPACTRAATQAGIEFVPGIELSADRASLKPPHLATSPARPAAIGGAGAGRLGTLHILGLFINDADGELQSVARQVRQARDQRNPRIMALLNELGVRIDYEEVLDLVGRHPGVVVGRPHIAQVLISKGYAKSVQDAFARYLGEGAPAYVRKDHLSPAVAIDAIHHAGGLAILAHPVQLRCVDDDELEHAVSKLAAMGLDGMETRHPDHTPAQVAQYQVLARRLDLLPAGGSDFHGDRKDIALGSQTVPLSVYQRLREAHARRAQKR